MRKRAVIVIGMILLFGSATVAHAAGNTREGLKSYGYLYFNNKTPDVTGDDAIIDTSDLIHIADRIDILRELAR